MQQKYTINQWYGRLGNNIQQISNSIYYCAKNKANFYCPPHPLINQFSINFGEDKDISSRFYFFDTYPIGEKKDFECDSYELNYLRREICLKFILPNLKINLKESLPEDTLVIHIRSGDIFISNPHRLYVQNPLYFYNNIIKNFEKVLIVSESDKNNPIIDKLKENKNVFFQSKSIEEDFSTLLAAKNLATSGVSTFSCAAALCSKEIKNLYCSNIYLTEHLNPSMLYNTHVNIHMHHLKNYIKIGEWKNTVEQRNFMLNYSGE